MAILDGDEDRYFSRRQETLIYTAYFVLAELLCIRAVIDYLPPALNLASGFLSEAAYAATSSGDGPPSRTPTGVSAVIAVMFSFFLGMVMLGCAGFAFFGNDPGRSKAWDLLKAMVTTSFAVVGGILGVSLISR